MTQSSPSLAIVLAAGKGTRMKSALPKVLHRIAGAPMIAHVLRAAQAAGIGKTSLVVGPGMEDVARAATALEPKLQVFVQAEQLGTADAVKAARQAFEDFKGNVLILYGDTPLLRAETLDAVRAELDGGADLVVIGFEAENPTGYGRLLLDDRGRLAAIREEKDASDAERALTLCNSGIMGFRSGKTLLGLLGRIGKNNAKGEFYLTDAVALAAGDRLETRIVTSNGEEVLGVNSRAELAQAEGAMQRRLRARVMADGATLIAPDTVFLSYDTKIGKDVLIEPHVVIGERVAIADGVDHQGVLASRRRPHRRGRDGRSVRAAPARGRYRQGRSYRQFRRDQAGRDRRRRQGQSSHLYRRCQHRRRRQYRRRHHHLQL